MEQSEKHAYLILTHRTSAKLFFFSLYATDNASIKICVTYNNSNAYELDFRTKLAKMGQVETFDSIDRVVGYIQNVLQITHIEVLYIEANLTDAAGKDITDEAMYSFVNFDPSARETHIFSNTEKALSAWNDLINALINAGLYVDREGNAKSPQSITIHPDATPQKLVNPKTDLNKGFQLTNNETPVHSEEFKKNWASHKKTSEGLRDKQRKNTPDNDSDVRKMSASEYDELHKQKEEKPMSDTKDHKRDSSRERMDFFRSEDKPYDKLNNSEQPSIDDHDPKSKFGPT